MIDRQRWAYNADSKLVTSVKSEIISALQHFQDQACNYQLSLLMASFAELYSQQFGKDALLMYVEPTPVASTLHHTTTLPHHRTTPPRHHTDCRYARMEDLDGNESQPIKALTNKELKKEASGLGGACIFRILILEPKSHIKILY